MTDKVNSLVINQYMIDIGMVKKLIMAYNTLPWIVYPTIAVAVHNSAYNKFLNDFIFFF